MKTLLIVVASLVLIGSVLGFTLSTPTPQTWEYRFEYKSSEKKFNELGSEGWELTGVESTSEVLTRNVPVYVFKRPKQ